MANTLMLRGAVRGICLHHFDLIGDAVPENEDTLTSISLVQLKRCHNVVALAGGMDKLVAMRAALAGGYIDVLVIDRITAESL